MTSASKTELHAWYIHVQTIIRPKVEELSLNKRCPERERNFIYQAKLDLRYLQTVKLKDFQIPGEMN